MTAAYRFVRSLVGLDREAAKQAFSEFLLNRKLTANQHEFLNMIIDHLTARGVMAPGCSPKRRSRTSTARA